MRDRAAQRLRDFRSYEAAELRPGASLTVVAGRNGAGKTNLLEALYFACTGRSCRTANEREVVRFGATLTRLELETEDEQGRHEVSVGFQPGEPKRLRADGAPVDRLTDVVRAPAGGGLPAGPPRAGARRAGAAPRARRPGRRRPVAGAGRHAPRVLGRARPAQRADRRRPRGPRGPRARSRPGTPRSPATASGSCATARRRSTGCATASPPMPARSGSRARPSSPTGRVRARRPPTLWPPSWRSGPRATSSAASPAMARTATSSRCGAKAASCAPTVRAARSGSACWRCSSPSAMSSRPSAAPRRCSCSTTS